MNGPRNRVPAALVSLTIVLLTCAACAPAVDVPDPSVAGMEPDVVALLEDSRRAVIDDPHSAAAWGRLGAAFHVHGLLDPAIRCYAAAVERSPDEFRWAYLLAVAQESGFEEALALDSNYAPAWLRLGMALSRTGRHDTALDAHARAVRLAPNSAMARRSLGQAFLALDDPHKAIDHLAVAARLRPDDAGALASLAQAYGKIGESELAREAASRAALGRAATGLADPLYAREVTALGASASLRYERVARQLAQQEFESAKRELAAIRQLRPDDADLHYLTGAVAVGENRLDEAEQALQRALELKADHTRAIGELAGVFEKRGRLRQALGLRKRAHDASPRDPSLLLAWARTLNSAGQVDGLVHVYGRLAKLQPNSVPVQIDLGTAWGRAGDLQRAEEHFRRAIRLDPDSANGHYRLGVALEATGRAVEAHRHYDTAVRIDSKHPARRRLPPPDAAAQASGPRRSEFQAIADRLYAGTNPYLGGGRLAAQRQALEAAGSNESRFEARAQIVGILLQAGEVERAVTEVEALARDADSAGGDSVELQRLRGLTYMRQAEVQNCVARHNADCCIFPLEGGGRHAVRGPAEKAKTAFLHVLEEAPQDLTSRWLLNVMAMALGE